jgi:hypothetical protein
MFLNEAPFFWKSQSQMGYGSWRKGIEKDMDRSKPRGPHFS